MKTNNLLIEKYIHEVVRRIPENMREDIGEELRSTIEDMLEERLKGAEPTDQDIEEVLGKLGKPSDLARQYRGNGKYLIGGEYYDIYFLVLKIALLVTLITNVLFWMISSVIELVVHTDTLGVNEIVRFSSSRFTDFCEIPGTLISVFGVVTLIFALIEYFNVKIDHKDEKWNPSKLHSVHVNERKIDISDSVVGLIFEFIFIAVIAVAPQLIGAYFKGVEGTLVNIPLFNLGQWNSIMPLMVILVLFSVIQDVVKLCVGRYNIAVALTVTITEVASVILAINIFLYHEVFNKSFVTDIEAITGDKYFSSGDLLCYYSPELLSKICIVIILIGMMASITKSVVLCIRNRD